MKGIHSKPSITMMRMVNPPNLTINFSSAFGLIFVKV